jgi:hypothetical protein
MDYSARYAIPLLLRLTRYGSERTYALARLSHLAVSNKFELIKADGIKVMLSLLSFDKMTCITSIVLGILLEIYKFPHALLVLGNEVCTMMRVCAPYMNAKFPMVVRCIALALIREVMTQTNVYSTDYVNSIINDYDLIPLIAKLLEDWSDGEAVAKVTYGVFRNVCNPTNYTYSFECITKAVNNCPGTCARLLGLILTVGKEHAFRAIMATNLLEHLIRLRVDDDVVIQLICDMLPYENGIKERLLQTTLLGHLATVDQAWARGLAKKIREVVITIDDEVETESENPCPVCLQDKRIIPVVFPCGHYFCASCANRVRMASKEAGYLSCPVCRKRHHEDTPFRLFD